jgi:glycerol-3-phosphate dehydrogenase
VQGRFFVNAAGPWIDRVLEGSRDTDNEQLIGGTKGSHIVVPPFTQTGSNAVYGEAKTDGRPFFIIPWNGNYLIGTTDIRFGGDPDEVRVETREVEYLLNETNRIFPNANLSQSDILYTYSGVRPLPYTGEHHHEERITRRHFIKQHHQLSNLVSIVGGKLTTFRSLAEECVDLVCRQLGMNSARCCTSDLPLPGARNFQAFADDFVKHTELTISATNRLLKIYGGRAGEVVEFCKSNGLLEYLDEQQTALTGEIAYSFQKECAATLSDCLMRRTMIGLNGDLGLGQVKAAVQIAREHASWSDERVESELQSYRSFTQRRRQPIRGSSPTVKEG